MKRRAIRTVVQTSKVNDAIGRRDKAGPLDYIWVGPFKFTFFGLDLKIPFRPTRIHLNIETVSQEPEKMADRRSVIIFNETQIKPRR